MQVRIFRPAKTAMQSGTGNTRDWVLGLKVVLPSGELLDLNGELFKNQTGYDLRNLIVGSEGTLAVIVEVTRRLTHPPAETIRARVDRLLATALRRVRCVNRARGLGGAHVRRVGKLIAGGRIDDRKRLARFGADPAPVDVAGQVLEQ